MGWLSFTWTGLVIEYLSCGDWRSVIEGGIVGNGLAKVLNSLYGKRYLNILWCELIPVREVCGWLIEYFCLLLYSISMSQSVSVSLSRRLGGCWRLWKRPCLKHREWTQRPKALLIWRSKIWKMRPRREKSWSKTWRR